MKLKSLLLLVLCVVAYSSPANAKTTSEPLLSQVQVQKLAVATPSWKEFSPEDNSFSVLMPDTSISKETKKTSVYVMDLYTASTEQGVFLVGNADFIQDLSGVKPEILLDSFSQGLIGNDGKILNQKNISLNANPGREIEFEKSGFTGKVRIFFKGKRLYYALLLAPQATTNADIDKYFDSFQLNSSK